MLVVMVGIPGSGKSSYAAANFRHIVSPDRIRAETFGTRFDRAVERAVWRTAYAETRALLAAGRVACFDATSATRRRRRRLVSIADAAGVPAIAIWIRTPPAEAWARNLAREAVVPRAAFRQLVEAFEPPSVEEGFTVVVLVGEEPAPADTMPADGTPAEPRPPDAGG